ncbi:predicted protein [Naegleria gruberi]|uniref:Predicted protein n=1 Tax=Naegleria gruberi TaxID=5762 RepID=D2VDI9_NAEGR|nr:uncharacterized protein NAEGRDRAFT_66859 [Naegleria gruberi]EFC45150.1 predicted protein [Naegleria gruberi]|eukprot:XP_002677894.1 predicted protein [Naegleria gruberi strain NEG-M]
MKTNQKKNLSSKSNNNNNSRNPSSSTSETSSSDNFIVTKQSSLCILIPNNHDDDNYDESSSGSNSSLFDHVQHIRQENDKSFNRWAPHLNLMYPFVHKKSFFKAKQLIEQVIIEKEQVKSFEIDFPPHHVYCRQFSKFVLASPTDEKQLEILQKIYAMLKEIFPQCAATGALEEGEGKNGNVEEKFHPHLTLGQLSNSNLANVKKTRNNNSTTNEFEKIKNEWQGGKFKVCELVFMWRESLEEPFHVTERIPLTI